MPRAVGMFGHSYNPGYFVNPPAYTYLLHVVFDLRFGGRAGGGGGDGGRPHEPCSRPRGSWRRCSARGAVALLAWAGRRLHGRRGRADRGRAAGRRVPAGALLAPGAQRRADARARRASRCSAWRRSTATTATAATRSPGWRSALACATKYTAGILVLTIVAAALATPVPGPRLRGLVLAGVLALAGFLAANPYALLDFDAFREGLSHQSEAVRRRRRQARPLHRQRDRLLPRHRHLGARLAARAGGARRRDRAGRSATAGSRWCSSRRRSSSSSSWAPRTASSRAGCCPSTRCCACSPRGRSVAAAVWLAPRLRLGTAAVAAGLGALLCLQGLVFSVHNDLALARDDTRAARPRLDGRQRPDPLQGRDRAVPARPPGRPTRRASARARATASAGTSGRPRARPTPRAAACSASRTTSATPARPCSAPTPAAATAGS